MTTGKFSIQASARAALAVAALLVTNMLAAPARAETAAAFMQRVAAELVTDSRSGSTSMFAATIRKYGDVQWLGLYSLGSYARAMPAADRPTYYNGVINFISRYVAKESPKYPVASAVITGTGAETREGIEVDSRVVLKDGTSYDVRWLVVRRSEGFKVRDAQVMGFWSSPFLKNLFENYISENGGNPKALIVALNR